MTLITRIASLQSVISLIESGSLSRWHSRIIKALIEIKEGNKYEINQKVNELFPGLNSTEDNIHKRLSELRSQGIIEASGELRQSKSSGKRTTVWRLII